jgi:hypothetical protein
MIAAVPAERVAEILLRAGYLRLGSPLQLAGLTFDVAGAFIGGEHSADLVIVGDMAADGERKVAQQIDGIARALDVMRSRRPLTSVIVGPRPVGRALETLAQVSRILAVEEAIDPLDLLDRLAVLLPLELPTTSRVGRESGSGELSTMPDNPFADALVRASEFGEDAVRSCFHSALNDLFAQDDGDQVVFS